MSFVVTLEAINKADGDIYVVTLPDDTEVIFKLPSFKQASQYGQILSVAEGNFSLQHVVYNHIFEEYVLDKYLAIHDVNIKAGIPETIAKLILYLSGVNDQFIDYTETLLDLFRSQSSDLLSTMKRTICNVFSGYKMSDLDKLTYQELLKLFVDAETVLVEQGIITDRLKIKEPEQPEVFSIEQTISKDRNDYRRFDTPEHAQYSRLTDDPAYKAKMEELRIKRKLQQRGG
jgi:hypothetical protein